MSGQAGYTLVETLVALMVVALAVGGMSAGVQVLMRQQTRLNDAAAQTQTSRLAQATLGRVLGRNAPYRSQEEAHFSGDSQSLRIDCGEAHDCVAAITRDAIGANLSLNADGMQRTWRLPATGRTHFLYSGALDIGEAWPPAAGRPQALRSLAVVDEAAAGAVTLVKTRVWAEEPANCDFDAVRQDCR